LIRKFFNWSGNLTGSRGVRRIMAKSNEDNFYRIDDKVIELKGAEKEAFIAQREADKAEQALLETEYKAKQDARESALKKLAEIAGLTEEELASIL
jgi:hypothetical protein